MEEDAEALYRLTIEFIKNHGDDLHWKTLFNFSQTQNDLYMISVEGSDKDYKNKGDL